MLTRQLTRLASRPVVGVQYRRTLTTSSIIRNKDLHEAATGPHVIKQPPPQSLDATDYPFESSAVDKSQVSSIERKVETGESCERTSTASTTASEGKNSTDAQENEGSTLNTGGFTLGAIREDHTLVRQNLDRLTYLTNTDEKQRLFNDTVKMLAQHDVAEEVVFYPAVKKLGGSDLYDIAIQQTVEAERKLYDMDLEYGMDINKPNFNVRLEELKKDILEHMALEEQELLPKLECELSSENISSINLWFERVKLLAPTRPHPDGPHSVAGNLATAPVVAFLDSIRDLGKKFS